MAALDHIILLLSFVFALAIAHLLSRVGSLMAERERVRFSALEAFMIVNALVMVFLNWISLYYLRNIRQWDLATVTILFVFALLTYLLCAAAAPEIPSEGTIDLEKVYWKSHRLFYGLTFLMVSSATLMFVFQPLNLKLYVWYNVLPNLPFFVPSILALTVRARWAQWASAVGLFAASVW